MARISLIEKQRAAIVLRNLYEFTERERGYVPNLFKAMAHRPELLVTFANFWKELWTGGGVDAKTKDIAGLRALALQRCGYGLTHQSAAAKRDGLSDAQITALKDGSYAASPAFGDREKAVGRLAEKLTREPNSISDDDLRQLRKWFGEADLVELTLLVGALHLTARFSACFAVQLEESLR